jgi:hypothetical protein
MYNFIEQVIPQEQKDLVNKWKATGLLEETDGWEQIQLSCLFENQLLLNDLSPNTKFWQFLKKISIPLIRRIFDPNNFILYKMVSVQTMASSSTSVYWTDKYNVFKPRPVQARSRLFKTQLPVYEHIFNNETDIKSWNDFMCLSNQYPELFDVEFENEMEKTSVLCDLVSRDIRQELIREVLFDLYSVVNTELANNFTHVWKGVDKFLDFFRMANSQFSKEAGGVATWMMVSPNLAIELFPEFISTGRICKAGDFNNCIVFVDPKFEFNEVLFGRRHPFNPIDSGYIYCPYCPLGFQVGEEDTKIITRYSKALINAKYYGLIKILGYSIKEKDNHV